MALSRARTRVAAAATALGTAAASLLAAMPPAGAVDVLAPTLTLGEVTASTVVFDLTVPAQDGRRAEAVELTWQGHTPLNSAPAPRSQTASLTCVVSAPCTAQVRVPRSAFLHDDTPVTARVSVAGGDQLAAEPLNVSAAPQRPHAWLQLVPGASRSVALGSWITPSVTISSSAAKVTGVKFLLVNSANGQVQQVGAQAIAPTQSARDLQGFATWDRASLGADRDGTMSLHVVAVDEHGIESSHATPLLRPTSEQRITLDSRADDAGTMTSGTAKVSEARPVGTLSAGADVPLTLTMPDEDAKFGDVWTSLEVQSDPVRSGPAEVLATYPVRGKQTTLTVNLPASVEGGVRWAGTTRVRLVARSAKGGAVHSDVTYTLGSAPSASVKVVQGWDGPRVRDGAVVTPRAPLSAVLTAEGEAGDVVRFTEVTFAGKPVSLQSQQVDCQPYRDNGCTWKRVDTAVLTPPTSLMGKNVVFRAHAVSATGKSTVITQTYQVRSSIDVTLTAKRSVRKGKQVPVFGVARKKHDLSLLKRQDVVLQYKAAGAKKWKSVRRVSTGSGAFRSSYRPARSGHFRWVVPAPNGKYVRSVSPTRKITVR